MPLVQEIESVSTQLRRMGCPELQIGGKMRQFWGSRWWLMESRSVAGVLDGC